MPSEYEEHLPHETAKAEPVESPRAGLGRSGIGAIQGMSEEPKEMGPQADASETQIIGNPERDAQFCHEQQHDDTCAIAAQEGIIKKHTGQDPGEEALRQFASENGWYKPGDGTKGADVAKLLDSHEIPTTGPRSADMDELRGELEQGHDVIAVVDAGLLWQDAGAIGEGHAVWVTGLETSQDGQVAGVFLNDSGNPDIDGGGKVPAGVFEAAWTPTGNSMVSTQDAVSESHGAGDDDEV